MIREFLSRLRGEKPAVILCPQPEMVRPQVAVLWHLKRPETRVLPVAWHRPIGNVEGGAKEELIDNSTMYRRPCPITLKNTGQVSTYNIEVVPLDDENGRLFFPEPVTVLSPGETKELNGIYERKDNWARNSLNFPQGLENYFLHQSVLRGPEFWKAHDFIEKDLRINHECNGKGYFTLAALRYYPAKMTGMVSVLTV